MTESEARKKWCPHALLTDGGMMYNRNALAPDVLQNGANCIASDCMLWVATDNECEPKDWSEALNEDGKCYPAGYCGLTNKP